MSSKATVARRGLTDALLLALARHPATPGHASPRPPRPLAHVAHRQRRVLRRAHRSGHQVPPARGAGAPHGRSPGRHRQWLRTDRPHAGGALTPSDGVGRRRERAGPGSHPRQRRVGGARERAGGSPGRHPGGRPVLGAVVEPPGAHRQGCAPRPARSLAGAARGRRGRPARRAEAPGGGFAAALAHRAGLVGRAPGQPGRLPPAGRSAPGEPGRSRSSRPAMIRQLDSTGLKRLHREWRQRSTGRVALVLDHVQSPFNVGSILRTAAALKVDHLWLVGDTAAPTNPKTAKTALGSQRFVEWTWHDTVTEALDAAHEHGYHVVGLELADDAVPLPELKVDAPVCLVIGHEDRGLSPATLAACDDVTFIPQLGRIGSLNVPTATAVALYEVRRREWSADA